MKIRIQSRDEVHFFEGDKIMPFIDNAGILQIYKVTYIEPEQSFRRTKEELIAVYKYWNSWKIIE